MDSNHRLLVPKTSGLPLPYTPKNQKGRPPFGNRPEFLTPNPSRLRVITRSRIDRHCTFWLPEMDETYHQLYYEPIFYRCQHEIHKKVEEGVGFEPTDAGAPSVFGTDAINRTRPPFRGAPCWNRTSQGRVCNPPPNQLAYDAENFGRGGRN